METSKTKTLFDGLCRVLEDVREDRIIVPGSVHILLCRAKEFVEKQYGRENVARLQERNHPTEHPSPSAAIQEIAKSILKMYQDVGETIERIAWKA